MPHVPVDYISLSFLEQPLRRRTRYQYITMLPQTSQLERVAGERKSLRSGTCTQRLNHKQVRKIQRRGCYSHVDIMLRHSKHDV